MLVTKSKNNGFTLIEILIVLLILSITTTFSLLAIGDFGGRQKTINAANHFANYILMVKKEAILESNTLMIKIRKNKYEVFRLKNNKNWQPIKLNIFNTQRFPKKTSVFLVVKKKYNDKIIINPSGDISPFTLNLGESRANITATVTGKADGSIIVKTL